MSYCTFFGLGIILYATAPFAGSIGNVALYVGIFCFILTMYGGGFATIPAYLAEEPVGCLALGAGRLIRSFARGGLGSSRGPGRLRRRAAIHRFSICS